MSGSRYYSDKPTRETVEIYVTPDLRAVPLTEVSGPKRWYKYLRLPSTWGLPGPDTDSPQ